MAGVSDTAIAGAHLGRAGSLWGKFAVKCAFLFELFKQAFETEAALRRPFLSLPVSASAGVVFYLYADRESSLWFVAPAAVTFGVLAYFAQAHRLAFFILCGLCALFAGELSAALRTALDAAGTAFRGRHICPPQGAAAAAGTCELTRRV
jgi:competence protein ComEC